MHSPIQNCLCRRKPPRNRHGCLPDRSQSSPADVIVSPTNLYSYSAMAVLTRPLPPQPSLHLMPEMSSKDRLRLAVQMGLPNWTYAIFWSLGPNHQPGRTSTASSSSSSSLSSVLRWGDGVYHGGVNDRRCTATPEEQELRRRGLRGICSILLNDGGGDEEDEDEEEEEEVSDTEWFYVMSMGKSFPTGAGMPGLAFASGRSVWTVGVGCGSGHRPTLERAREAHEYGFQTLICVPTRYGVVELGSTEAICPNSEFTAIVRHLFFDLNIFQVTLPDVVPPQNRT